ncbi:putative beta-lactamase [Trichophyton rubrum]|nr:putative beta-lactamase [Trichophyton rubrum]
MIQGFTGFHGPIYCFLVSSGTQGVVFDLGIRTDWRNYAPKVVSVIEETTVITIGSDVASTIEPDAGGLNLRRGDIQAVIWSRKHFDHIGDMSLFPPTTELINPDSFVLESDTAGRVVREISFDNCPSIGRFRAMDYFDNGSFYLLDAPGHAQGHLCALARATADPHSLIIMGADACHHPGVLRSSSYLPLPVSVKQGEVGQLIIEPWLESMLVQDAL